MKQLSNNLYFLFLCMACFLSGYIVITGYMNNNVVFLELLILLIVILIQRPGLFRYVLVAVAMVIGLIIDCFFCKYDWWVYKNPSAPILFPIWLLLAWSILVIIFAELAILIYMNLNKFIQKTFLKWLYGLLTILILGYTLFTVTHINRFIAAALLGMLLVTVLFSRYPFNIVLFMVAALLGTAGEILCMRYDVWYYTRPYFPSTGIPLSLPLAWGLNVNVVWSITRLIVRHDPAREIAEK